MAYGNSYPRKNGYRKDKKNIIVPGSQYKPVSCPSPAQQDIFETVVDGSGSLLIRAFAGTGKTTSVVESAHRVHRKNPALKQGYLIYAKRNQEEAVGKFPASAPVKTAHSFGLMALGATFGKITVDKQKTNRITDSLIGYEEEKDDLRHMLAKSIDLAKDYLAETPEEIVAMLEKHNIETCTLSEQEFANKVLEGMRIALKQPTIVSFSDMIWAPLKLGIRIPTFDLLYVDEIQDMNRSRIELMMRALGDKGRLVGVGDERQSIFQFTGADRHAMALIKQRANAQELPLHITYRCCKSIVRLAQQFVPGYLAADSNAEGEVRDLSLAEMMGDDGARAGDFILSRTNAPMIKIAMQFLARGKKCNIQGKSIGDDLLFMIKRSRQKDVSSFQSWLSNWSNSECERLLAKNKNEDVSFVLDKVECLETFCQGTRDLTEVKNNIHAMFDDNETDEEHRIVLSSVHRSKGLERERVFVLEKTFTMKPKNEDEELAESNVKYVAFTRAKNSLFLVE